MIRHARRVPLLLLTFACLLVLLSPLLGRRGSIGATPRRAEPNTLDAAVAADPRADYSLVLAGMEGETLAPWLRSAAQLNQPWGVVGDGDFVWVADAAGRRALKFASNARYLDELGKAGLIHALDGSEHPLRFVADVAVQGTAAAGDDGSGDPAATRTPTPTPTPRGGGPRPLDRASHATTAGGQAEPARLAAGLDYLIWLVDSQAHAAYGVDPASRAVVRVLGTPDEPGADDRHFQGPSGIAVGEDGRVYVSDTGNQRIQVFGPDDRLLATIGQTGVAGGGPNQFNRPGRLAVGEGVLYVADTGNHRALGLDIVDPANARLLYTYGQSGQAGTDYSHLDAPLGLTIDASFVYVADSGNCRVQVWRKRQATFWKSIPACKAPAGAFLADRSPSDVALDARGYVYVADPAAMQVHQLNPDWTPLRDFGSPGKPYLTDAAHLNGPMGVAWGPEGRLAMVEGSGQRLIVRSADGQVAYGLGQAGIAGIGESHLDRPTDLAYDGAGSLHIVEQGAAQVRVLASDGGLLRVIGGPGTGDGRFRCPEGLALGADGAIYLADPCDHRVQVLGPDGSFRRSLGLAGQPGRADDRFDSPSDVAVDGSGRIYVADTGNHRVQVFDSGGRFLRRIGTGSAGREFDRLRRPRRLAVGTDGKVYVADTGNQRVLVLAPDDRFLAAVGGQLGASTGQLREPLGLAVDAEGRLAVADSENHRVLRMAVADEPWTAWNRSGFGHPAADAIGALATFGDGLYAATQDADHGAALWRRESPDGPWTAVLQDGNGDVANRAVTDLTVWNGALYAGVRNLTVTTDPATGSEQRQSQGGAIWRSADGSSWQTVAGGGLGDKRNAALGAFAGYGQYLYAGSQGLDATRGAEVWRSSTGAAGSWERVVQGGFDADPGNQAIGAMGVFTGTLFAGTCQTADRPELWQTRDGKRWSPAGPYGQTAIGNGRAGCVTSLVDYDGWLYAGLGSDSFLGGATRTAEVWRCRKCEGSDWEQVARDGLGSVGNRGRVALTAFEEPPFRYLYLAVGNAYDGLELWRAADGQNWEQAGVGGLGDGANTDIASGKALAAWYGRLWLGTVNGGHGGEIWSTAGFRPGAAPTVATRPGPVATATPRPRPAPSTGRAAYALVDQWPLGQTIAPDIIGNILEMAVGADGTTYLLDASNNRVMRLGPDGGWLEAFGNSGRGPDRVGQVGALAVDDAGGRIYVADIASERILVYDAAGRFIVAWPEIHARGIEVQPDGTLWVADRLADAARHFAPDGSELGRFGTFGNRDEDQFQDLIDLTVDAGGLLHVADQGGVRVRSFRPEGPSWRRTRTMILTDPKFQGCLGAQPRRITALGPGRIMADACIILDGDREDVFPANHRSSDLYGVQRRTANMAAGRFAALAVYDSDRINPENPTYPAVVSYLRETFDLVAGFSLGRARDAASAAQDGAIGDPVRLSTAPDGSLMLSDGFGLRQRSPTGVTLSDLPNGFYPSRLNTIVPFQPFLVGQGREGRVMGVGQEARTGKYVTFYAKSVTRRYCRAGQCQVWPYFEVIWDTTLPTETDAFAAVAHEPTRDQFVVLHRFHTAPSTRGMEAISSRLYVYPLGGMGRKTELLLDGNDREAIWADVDAGPTGRIYVLDTLNDRVQVYGPDLVDLGKVATPKDAWRVAGGPNNEIFVLTVYGQVVRMAADGTVLSRFVGRPHDGVPPTSLVDLAVDKDGWVYTVDELANQVTVFAPEGTEDQVLQGERCQLGGDKWVDPKDILLGDSTQVYLSLFGTCGFVEQPADIVVAVNTLGLTMSSDWGRQLADNLRRARQIVALTDLDRHRVGIVSFSRGGQVDQELTGDSYRLVRALFTVTADRGMPPRNYGALRAAQDVFKSSSAERLKVIVILRPGEDDDAGIDLAEQLKAQGYRILIVNLPGSTAYSAIASGDLYNNIEVDPRAMGAAKEVHRRMLVRDQPANLARTGTLVDELPANMDYQPGSAQPPAAWDAGTRTLTWAVADLDRLATHGFSFRVRPTQEGLWPTNVRARAQLIDGWGQPASVDFPVPMVRVYGEAPTPTPTRTATPTVTPTPTATASPTATREPQALYLPLLLHLKCGDTERNADVVLVLDASTSMNETTSPGGPTKLQAAKDAARAFLGQLVAGRDQAALVQFNSEATLLVDLTDQPAIAIAGLDRISQSGGTAIDKALTAGAAVLRGPGRRASNNAVLILLTDGEPTGTTREQVLAAALEARSAALVFTIGLGTAVDQDLMRAIASRPNGFFYAPDTSQLALIYSQIAYEIPCRPGWP